MPSFSPYNHAVGNPIKFVDKEGDGPSPSNWLAKSGVSLPPLAAGLIDGIAGASMLGTASIVYDLATDPKFRSQMIDAFKTIASDPVGFLGATFTEYKDLLTRVASGKATPEDMKKIGEEIGGYLAGAVGGGAVTKRLGKVKAFQKLKTSMAAAQKKVLGKGGTPIVPKCPKCFTELTQINTTKGFKNIKDIVVGDSVWSFNEQSGLFTYQRVLDTHMRISDSLIIVYALGTYIETTPEHPFLVGGNWVNASKLNTQTLLTLGSGAQVKIDSIKLVLTKTPVYNFTVKNNSTYAVGNHGILVHNCEIEVATDVVATKKVQYRKTLQQKTGKEGKGYDAHHTLPKSKEFDDFFKNAGLDVHDADNLIWRQAGKHRGSPSAKHLQLWREFMRDNPAASKEMILKHRNVIEKQVFGNVKGNTPRK